MDAIQRENDDDKQQNTYKRATLFGSASSFRQNMDSSIICGVATVDHRVNLLQRQLTRLMT